MNATTIARVKELQRLLGVMRAQIDTAAEYVPSADQAAYGPLTSRRMQAIGGCQWLTDELTRIAADIAAELAAEVTP
jgi:hypothetical protein